MRNSVVDIRHCYGCGICVITCSHQAITMQLDSLGFYRPIVDVSKCVDCGLCRRNCAYLYETLNDEKIMPKEWFAGWSKETSVVSNCSSGGVAYELAKTAIEQGYKVIGVKYNTNNHRAEHVICSTIDDLSKIKGSKYLPSYTIDAFKKIKKGEKWMIIGTPCQIDSLRKYVKMLHMEADVLLVDFFCHGVPSYNMWKKCLSQFLRGKNIESIVFRSKKNIVTNKDLSWHDSYVLTICEKQGVFYQPSLQGHFNWFYHYFLDNLCLGLQCYSKCKYKMFSTSADIRIGDAWCSAFQNNKKGVSAVLLFTDIGVKLIKQIKNIHIEEVKLKILSEGQMRIAPKIPQFYELRLRLMRLKILRFGHIEQLIKILEKFALNKK